MLLPSTSDAIARGMSYDINRIVNIFIYIYIYNHELFCLAF